MLLLAGRQRGKEEQNICLHAVLYVITIQYHLMNPRTLQDKVEIQLTKVSLTSKKKNKSKEINMNLIFNARALSCS